MAGYHVPPLESLVEKFESLPGIGHKTAQRLAYFVLDMPKEQAEGFAGAILEAHEKIHYCAVCCNLTDDELCPVCRSPVRDKALICVVEEPKDVFALERAGEYNGLYHVLHGAISPLSGIGPEQLKIKELLPRIDGGVREVIMATNPTVEGEATAMYLSRLLKPLGVKVTRLAYGIPVGGDLEYADEVTLQRAMEGRQEL
ncbi:recombination mediator RecR [Oscillospiraceae bacterium 21-37]|uniref:recombination mediator RecR n=1 Tax=Eubacteriales TaxID=186802 RepID=UPI0013685536|nr:MULTISPECIES: recombination mediator RecR [unclassified Neglectibacter]MCI8396041.1 recombination protein RecR [Acutalibacter sp.]MCI8922286.1 recombination protein RecR [Acutalibacter sp.]NBI17605.1 recombination protein RecR [Neglectibacter sp. 59]NBJ73103.1 recombination protein RecR [Neglectibacter sp. X4]NCE81034.1 recombination protein RecR [Neglectibacter sp. X58]